MGRERPYHHLLIYWSSINHYISHPLILEFYNLQRLSLHYSWWWSNWSLIITILIEGSSCISMFWGSKITLHFYILSQSCSQIRILLLIYNLGIQKIFWWMENQSFMFYHFIHYHTTTTNIMFMNQVCIDCPFFTESAITSS